MQNSKYDYAFKFILVGDTGVGKTSIISRFITGEFSPDHEFTIGVEFGAKTISVNNRVIKLQIWDTAGQEQFRAVTRSYYRSSAAALVIFDTTRKETFRSVARWVEDVRNNSNKDVVLVLIGNKVDLVQERMVSRNEAAKLSQDFGMLYLQTSALRQDNVERAFVWPAGNILDRIEGGYIKVDENNPSIKIFNNVPENKRPECEC